ncbi:MAG TPA: hypothetical protein VFI24_05505 [Pyrinomonadaceae bacterium]|nr:hypothetical protein [Pyrinomonadaceae bacterium]
MKRCPQCEFIYEDDQSLCDMDGVLLVFDSRTLPNINALTTTPPAKPQLKRKRSVPAFATLILALVLGMVYYVSMQRKAAQSTYAPPPAASTESSAAVPVESPAQVVSPAPEPQPVVEEPKTPAIRPSAAAAPAKKVSAKTASSPAKPATPPKKEESKVGSILKKTGRILKKPFKL